MGVTNQRSRIRRKPLLGFNRNWAAIPLRMWSRRLSQRAKRNSEGRGNAHEKGPSISVPADFQRWNCTDDYGCGDSRNLLDREHEGQHSGIGVEQYPRGLVSPMHGDGLSAWRWTDGYLFG